MGSKKSNEGYHTAKNTDANLIPVSSSEVKGLMTTNNKHLNIKTKSSRHQQSSAGSGAFTFAKGALSSMGLRPFPKDSYAGASDWSDNRSEDSYHSFKNMHKDRLFIAKNNLKLNIFLNLFLFACLALVFSLDWFCYETDD